MERKSLNQAHIIRKELKANIESMTYKEYKSNEHTGFKNPLSDVKQIIKIHSAGSLQNWHGVFCGSSEW